MSRAIRGRYRRYATSGEYTWYIDKCIKRVGRLCESTGTADRDEAERYLLHRIRELRDIAIYGVRRRRKFHGPLRLGAALRGHGARAAAGGRARAAGELRRVGQGCRALGADARPLPAAAVRPWRELSGRARHVPGGRDG